MSRMDKCCKGYRGRNLEGSPGAALLKELLSIRAVNLSIGSCQHPISIVLLLEGNTVPGELVRILSQGRQQSGDV